MRSSCSPDSSEISGLNESSFFALVMSAYAFIMSGSEVGVPYVTFLFMAFPIISAAVPSDTGFPPATFITSYPGTFVAAMIAFTVSLT